MAFASGDVDQPMLADVAKRVLLDVLASVAHAALAGTERRCRCRCR
jgi:hypothetical protein